MEGQLNLEDETKEVDELQNGEHGFFLLQFKSVWTKVDLFKISLQIGII